MLKLTNLSHTYANGTKALDDVSLDIPKGLFGLLGPNGAGKSTLMRCIATLQTPTQGTILFGDVDVIKTPELLRATLGYLPQDFGVYPRVCAIDLLDHLAILKGIGNKADRKNTIETLLVQVNLWDVRKKAVAGFSGGMRQRFGIAQALIGNPTLMIVDEPTAGLDPEERNRFNNLLAKIGETVVIILSTHIVDDVADLCPRMAIISDGKILQTGSPTDLSKDIQGRVWRKTIAMDELTQYQQNTNVISNQLRAGQTIIHVLADETPGAGFQAVDGNLEDLYFATLAQSRQTAAQTKAA